MDFMTAMRISASALSVQRTRVNIASSNLANAETTRGVDGQPYRRKDPLLRAMPFDDKMEAAWGNTQLYQGVEIETILEDQTEGRRVFDPSHPDANEDGFITLPNIDPVHEVVNLMSASRSYEANATAFDTLKGMAQRALEILR